MQDELENMRQVLGKIRETKRVDRGIESVPTKSQIEGEAGPSK
jgi:hypothetical protein